MPKNLAYQTKKKLRKLSRIYTFPRGISNGRMLKKEGKSGLLR
jgi:hypothetical protein